MTPTPVDAEYSRTLGLRLLRELARQGRYVFTVEEARAVAPRLGISDPYLPPLLSRLTRSGWLMRLRRGLYATQELPSGEVSVHPFAVATRLVEPSAISHWSAMHHHGLTEQVPLSVTASTPRKVVVPSMRARGRRARHLRHAWEIAGVRYEYVTLRPSRFFGIEEVWVDEHFKVPITDRERTVLEGFASPRAFGGMSEVIGTLDEHADELDLEKLVAYALRFERASIARRLGWALEQVGAPPSVFAPLEQMPGSGIRLLDPTRPPRGPYNRRWKIQNNLG